jgi:DNA-binding transcriptional LysR family regulator
LDSIRLVHIKDLDLNLLHVFQAVQTTRSVSRAAAYLGLSQPAVSHALTRLRLTLKDPLFVRAPGGVAPTSKAEHFARYVESALKTLDVAIHEADSFEPARSERRFIVHMSDIGEGEFLPGLMRAVGAQAPQVHVEARQLEPKAILPALENGSIDLAVGYLPDLSGTEQARMLDERYVVLVRKGHPLAREIRTRASLQRLDYILVKSHAEPAKALAKLGLDARIRLALPHFNVIPSIVAATDLAVIVPSRPAAHYAKVGGLVVLEPDVGLPPFTVSLHWYWRVHNDPGNRWLREQVLTLFQEPAGTKRAERARRATAARR